MANKLIPDDLITTISDFKKETEGFVNISGKEYALVSTKVAVLRRNLGAKLKINTEIVSVDNDRVVVKATGMIGDQVIATGHAEEKRNANFINKQSALENCETSAVGRMCSFLGISNDSIASAEEVSIAIEQSSNKMKSVLEELQKVSHAGNYQQWLANNKQFLAELKAKNPIAYAGFMENFTTIKNQLKTKGVLQ